MFFKKCFFLFLFFFSLFGDKQESLLRYRIVEHLNYMNPVVNGLFGLVVTGLTEAILKKTKLNFFNRYQKFFPIVSGVFGISVPYFVSRLQAKHFYKDLSYEYLLKHYQSIKDNNLLFYKSSIIHDYRDTILKKANLPEKGANKNKKYNLLLDLLTNAPAAMIDKLSTEKIEEQLQFLFTIMLIDQEKYQDNKKRRSFADSLFWHDPQVVKLFLERVKSLVAAEFIFLYWKDNADRIKEIIKDIDARKIADMCNVKSNHFKITNEICLSILHNLYDSTDQNEQTKGEGVWQSLSEERKQAIIEEAEKEESLKNLSQKNKMQGTYSKNENINNQKINNRLNNINNCFDFSIHPP